MNYLAHAFLSFRHEQILVGNMLGDYIKGTLALSQFPEGIKDGIMLHRKIDTFTDLHPAVKAAQNLFRADYGKYSGIFVDTVFDYYLANDPRFFIDEKSLFEYSQSSYAIIEKHLDFCPDNFKKMFGYMQSENWFYNYRTLKGMQKAFKGLTYRAKYLSDPDKAYEIFVAGYYELNQRYYDLIDDLYSYVKNELSLLHLQ